MKFHIVRNGETTSDITLIYSLSLDELKEENKHIRDWNRLIPGTKLKIPVITEIIDQDILDMEPFVEDYYPRKQVSINDTFDEINNINNNTNTNTNSINNSINTIDKENCTNSCNTEANNINENRDCDTKEEHTENINSEPLNKEVESIKGQNIKTLKNDIKKEQKHKLRYYPYYYYNPYNGQYYVYYSPVYVKY